MSTIIISVSLQTYTYEVKAFISLFAYQSDQYKVNLTYLSLILVKPQGSLDDVDADLARGGQGRVGLHKVPKVLNPHLSEKNL